MGDLLATSPHHHDRYLIEVALVGGGTQSKWRGKINDDREKLLQLTNPSGPGILHKVQLVFLTACNDTQLLQNWDCWLQEILFYPDSPIHAQCTIALNSAKLPSPGEMTVIAWNID